jgi:hypothetical protein
MRSPTLVLLMLGTPAAGAALSACGQDQGGAGFPPDASDVAAEAAAIDGSLGGDATSADTGAGDAAGIDSDGAPNYFPSTCADGGFCTADAGLDPRYRVHDIVGPDPQHLWVFGAEGVILQRQGPSWVSVPTGNNDTLARGWVQRTGEVWAVESLSTVNVRIVDPPPDAGAADAGPSDASDGADASPDAADAAVPFDGWTVIQPSGSIPAGDPVQVFAFGVDGVWGSPDDAYLWWVSSTEYTRFGRMQRVGAAISVSDPAYYITPDTSDIVDLLGAARLYGIWGTDASSIWVVGQGGQAALVSSALSPAPGATLYNTQTIQSLYGVWGTSPTDMWAVGENGTIRHYRGAFPVWDVVTSSTTVTLRAVRGSSPSDVWAVGDQAVVLHYDGSTWSQVPVAALRAGTRPDLYALWVGGGEVWVGGNGVLLGLQGGGQ